VLEIRGKTGLDLKKITSGAVLKRCNRSRGFSTKFARHKKEQKNYSFPKGLICKKLCSTSMVAGSSRWSKSIDFRHGRPRKLGERKRRGRGSDLMPYPQQRSSEATGFRSRKGRRRSAHLLFLGGGARQGRLAGGGYGCKGLGLVAVGQGHDAGLRCVEARGAAALMVAAHGLSREIRLEGGVEHGGRCRAARASSGGSAGCVGMARADGVVSGRAMGRPGRFASWWRGCTGKGGAVTGNDAEGLGWVL
jgi:hypothetical protein